MTHPIAANNVSDMFPPQGWSVSGLARGCRDKFGVTPRPAWLPLSMGLDGGLAGVARAASKVIFTNGLLDPWSAQSVTTNASATLVAINIPDGSQCADARRAATPLAAAHGPRWLHDVAVRPAGFARRQRLLR